MGEFTLKSLACPALRHSTEPHDTTVHHLAHKTVQRHTQALTTHVQPSHDRTAHLGLVGAVDRLARRECDLELPIVLSHHLVKRTSDLVHRPRARGRRVPPHSYPGAKASQPRRSCHAPTAYAWVHASTGVGVRTFKLPVPVTLILVPFSLSSASVKSVRPAKKPWRWGWGQVSVHAMCEAMQSTAPESLRSKPAWRAGLTSPHP